MIITFLQTVVWLRFSGLLQVSPDHILTCEYNTRCKSCGFAVRISRQSAVTFDGSFQS